MPTRTAFTIVLYLCLVCVAEGGQSPFMKFTGVAQAPMGWARFCRDYPVECLPGKRILAYVPMTRESWIKITLVNWWVNHHITYRSDEDHWGVEERWNFGEDGFGDCEDFALRKQLILAANGFPKQALLVAAVTTSDGRGHAVLLVRTQTADYVLDITDSSIHAWKPTTYMYDVVQSPLDPNVWLAPAQSARRIAKQ